MHEAIGHIGMLCQYFLINVIDENDACLRYVNSKTAQLLSLFLVHTLNLPIT